MMNGLQYWKIRNGYLFKVIYNNSFPTLIRLPITNYNHSNLSSCIKSANKGDSIYSNEAQTLINNLGDLRIK